MKSLRRKVFMGGAGGERVRQTELGPLPESWRVLAIREECLDCAFGPRFSSSEYAPDGAITTLRTTGMDDNGSIDYTHAPRANLDPARFGPHFLKDGDIVVSRSGTCGIASVFEGYERPVLPGAFLIRLRMRDCVWPQFLRYYLNSPPGRVRTALIAEGAIQKNISGTRLQDFRIPLPPLDEQRRIAAVLSAVQRAVERQERLIVLTAELKKALMHKLFTEGTRGEPLKQTEIGPVPESWRISPVRELCDLVSGGTPSKTKSSFWNGAIPWASPKDMKLPRLADTQDHVTQTGVDEGSRLVPPRSIFVVIRGMILMRDVPIALTMVPMAFNQDMKALINFRSVTSDFMLYSLQNARDRLRSKVGSSAHGTRTLMTSAIEQLSIAVPAGPEQELISRALRVLEDKCDNHDGTRRSLQALFRTLLHQLMTAQMRVHDLDLSALEEAAEAAGARP